MIIDEALYREFYSRLKGYDDIERMAVKHPKLNKELFLVIFTQKTIRDVTSRFSLVRSHSKDLIRDWKKGTSLMAISRGLEFSPVMTAFIIMTAQGTSRNMFKKMVNDPSKIPDRRLRREIGEVVAADPIYSPKGNLMQRDRGIAGEERLKKWLDERNIEYKREEDLRAGGGKTPDFLLEKPIFYRGDEIHWIESKGSFGDIVEVKKNLKKQLNYYLELFGPGMVIYWFGTVDDLPLEDGILIETEDVLSDRWDLE